MSRVLLIEDHDAFRQSLAFMLEREPGLEVVGQAGSLGEARRVASENLEEVDVVVVDLLLPDGNGMELVREIRRVRSGLPVVLTIVVEPEVREWVSAMGADTIVSKDIPREEIMAAIWRVGDGAERA